MEVRMNSIGFSRSVGWALIGVSGCVLFALSANAATVSAKIAPEVTIQMAPTPTDRLQSPLEGFAQEVVVDSQSKVQFTTDIPHSIVPVVRLLPSVADPCAERSKQPLLATEQGITIDEQVRLADFGRTDPNGAAYVAETFTVSPDGTQAALIVSRANPDVNAHCQRLVLVSVNSRAPEIELDRGGEFIRGDFQLRNLAVVYAGSQKSNPPVWSPDGTQIAFLKRLGGSTQVWVVATDGRSTSRRVTDLPDNVESFAWADDGAGLVVETRPGIRKQAAAIAEEGRRGFLFDERFSPQFIGRPIPTGSIEVEHSYVSLTDGSVRAANAVEVDILVPTRPQAISPRARLYNRSSKGHEAWIEPKNREMLFSSTQLVLAADDGRRLICADESCESIFRIWWSNAGDTLFALQRTGWGNSQTAILSWRVADASPKRILATDEMLFGCRMAGPEFVCAREGATEPRHLVAVEPSTRAVRVVHQPNDTLRTDDFGEVRRLRFRNNEGIESYADLVLPRSRRPGEKFPLVVVGYRSDGFLRGGTGDEVPIHPLVNRGIAVLSFHRPFLASVDREARTEKELLEGNRKNWRDRRSVQSALEIAIQMAVETGHIDRERLGITGFSDGAATAQWALINTEMFKAASLSSLGEDKFSYFLQAGPEFTDRMRNAGYKILEEDGEGFWEPYSLIANVDRVDVAILVQVPDTEYEGGLDIFEVYSHAGKAIEMYVFEDEAHVKWQPAHRLAVYQRNVEWFQFWLAGRKNCDPDRTAQYERWTAMVGAPAADQLVCASKN